MVTFLFLDIKITRHNQQFKTSVYRKPTFSGVFTHYESYVDQTYKKSLALSISLLFNLLWLHLISFGSWKFKRNLKKE